jgi:hypothetical protein
MIDEPREVLPPWEGEDEFASERGGAPTSTESTLPSAVAVLPRRGAEVSGRVLRVAKQRGYAEPRAAAAEYARTGAWPDEPRSSIRRTATGWRWQELHRWRFGHGEVRVVLRDDAQHGLVAVARKMAVILHRMWRDGADFGAPVVKA